MNEIAKSIENSQMYILLFRLHAEQRISIEKQLQSFSTGAEGGAAADTIAISNLEEQVKCAVEVNIPTHAETSSKPPRADLCGRRCLPAPVSRVSLTRKRDREAVWGYSGFKVMFFS